MKHVITGIILKVIGLTAFFITISQVENWLWTIPSLVVVAVGFCFQIAAFVQAKQQGNEIERRYRSLIG